MIQKSRTGVGLQMALAMMLPPKSKAAPESQPTKNETVDNHAKATSPPYLTGRWDFSRLLNVEANPEIVTDLEESAEHIQHTVHNAWRMTVRAAKHKKTVAKTNQNKFVPKPMTHEEISLWLQSFNAGPYACLKYEGNVPYEETRNYVPRVMKYYEQDLDTEYDDAINKMAAKYGLDPQMIRAIMKTESNFRNDTVSHAGARGLMQVMPVVWTDIKKKYDLNWEYSTGVFDPDKNIEVACAYLAWLRYDFLPRHFAAYESDPAAPVVLVRDKDRGVPDRESPRIIVKAEGKGESPVQIASADSKNSSDDEKTDADDKKKTKRAAIEISDAEDKKTKKSSTNGKTRVVVQGGKGKSVSISVDDKGKISSVGNKDARNKDAEDRKELEERKRPSIAKAKSREEENQGG